ncbi:hypothetical protein N9N67_10685 [Bacteriovoracaceae bacterium]|nr:hypothetical protein [Bacteriovoracaceae bacterium]
MLKLAFIGLLTLVSNYALACSCQEIKGHAKETLKSSKTVFLGIPTKDSSETGVVGEYEQEQMKTNFKIVKKFKGYKSKRKKTATVYSTKGDGANCGVHFKKTAAIYLVFTYKRDGKLYTNGCNVLGVGHNEYTAETLLELL